MIRRKNVVSLQGLDIELSLSLYFRREVTWFLRRTIFLVSVQKIYDKS